MIEAKYYDLINRTTQPKKEQKTGDEIVADIISRAGLEIASWTYSTFTQKSL